MALEEYSVIVEITKHPLSVIHVRYSQTPDMKNKGFITKDMFHIIDNTTMTNMCHMINDVMTAGLFSPLRVQIEHEVEMARRIREGADRG